MVISSMIHKSLAVVSKNAKVEHLKRKIVKVKNK
jgi:hypothetical protein